MTSPFTRPDGRTYRPQKPGLRVRAWGNDDMSRGVIVFGTLSPEAAQPLAQETCEWLYGEQGFGFRVTHPRPGWYRDSFQHGERTWVTDDRRGAPGVMFTYEETY